MGKGKRTELPHTMRLRCPDCGQQIVAQMVLNPAEGEAVDCSACGARLATIGDLMERVMKAAAAKLYAGLQRRRDNLAGG